MKAAYRKDGERLEREAANRKELYDVKASEILQSSEINSPSKLRPWSECNLSGTPYFINHDDTNIFAVVAAV
jgi:hypothetical protein